MSQINVNTIKDKSGLGAPNFPNGVNATGVVTATSFSGDGGNLTGIAQSQLVINGLTKVQATTSGTVITGIATANNFKTGSTNVHDVGVEAAGINVLGADTPIGTGATIYNNGNVTVLGTVTAPNFSGAIQTAAQPNITSLGTLSSLNVSGGVSIGGTLTYEDVTNVDSVGLVTARNGIKITGGDIEVGKGLKHSHSASATEYTVKVITKTAAHRYNGTGSGLGYTIDGVESPFLTLTPGRTYKFDQADSSNNTHQIKFYKDINKNAGPSGSLYETGVTYNGTAGQAGAYTQIVVSDTTPQVLHYQCVNHDYMGNSASMNSNVVDNFNPATIKNIRLGSSGDSEIDTSSGNLTLDSAGGTVAVDDNLTVSGTAFITGTAEFSNRRYNGGGLETAGSNNWWKIGTISSFGGGNAAKITINGVAGYGQDDNIVGHTVIILRRDNGSAQGVRGHFYGVGTNSSYGGPKDVATKPTGTANEFDIYVLPDGHYSNIAAFVDLSTGAATWTASNADTGSTSAPVSSTLLQKSWGIKIGASNTNSFSLNSSGQLAQATTTPRERVHFHHESSDENYIRFTNSTTGTAAGDGFNIGLNSSEQALIWLKESNSMLFGTAGTTALTINSSQNATFAGTVSDSLGNLRSIPMNTQSGAGNYDLVVGDSGKCVLASGNVTFNTGIFSAGDAVTIINNTNGNITITQGSGAAMYWTQDGTNASRTLATRGMASIYFTHNTTGYIGGSGLT